MDARECKAALTVKLNAHTLAGGVRGRQSGDGVASHDSDSCVAAQGRGRRHTGDSLVSARARASVLVPVNKHNVGS